MAQLFDERSSSHGPNEFPDESQRAEEGLPSFRDDVDALGIEVTKLVDEALDTIMSVC